MRREMRIIKKPVISFIPNYPDTHKP